MSTILEEIAAHARARVAADKEKLPLGALKEHCAALGKGGGRRFYEAVRKDGLSLICEVKKASPSKGVIAPVFDYRSIAASYEKGGADCVSCLTEPRYFLGSDQIFSELRGQLSLPMLRKDFVVDAYQIYQARLLGADCVLLICALMDAAMLEKQLELCRELGLAALTETHDEAEIATAISAGAEMIGVNNRNLKDFSVDLGNAVRLREQIPKNILYIAESGIASPEDAGMLRKAGADAVLVGELLMRSNDPAAMIRRMRDASK